MFSVELLPGAARQIADARDGWFANRDETAFAFDQDLDALVGLFENALGGGRSITPADQACE